MNVKTTFQSIVIKTITVAFVIAGVATNNVFAGVITPVGVAVSSGTVVSPASFLIDGSGLSEVGPILTQTHTASASIGNWKTSSSSIPGASLDFDLGGLFTVTDAHIWNYTDPVEFRVAVT